MPEYLEVPFEVKAEDISEDGSFKGYASLFDKKPDAYRDLVAKGAFQGTIARGGRNGTGVAMLWQHKSDKVPGVWSKLYEDSKGLVSEGRLALKTSLGNDIYEIMRLAAEVGTFKMGQSIGYDAIEYEVDEKKKIRTLKEVELWEISLVTFPAKLGASVLTVKSIEDAKTERELETVLREAGLSKTMAQYLVKLCKPSLREAGKVDKVEAGVLGSILESLTKTTSALESKSVIPFKSFDLAPIDEQWKATENVRAASVSDLQIMCTWYDKNNEENKVAYKLPHHRQNGYATVWRGVSAAMARLLQKGTKIPEADRRGCYNHLAKHYNEFGKDVPEFKAYSDREWKSAFGEFSADFAVEDVFEGLRQLNEAV